VLVLDDDVTFRWFPDFFFDCDVDLLYSPGPGSPLNAGVFMIRPRIDLWEEAVSLLRNARYSPQSGWFGAGHGACRQSAACNGEETLQGFLYYLYVQRAEGVGANALEGQMSIPATTSQSESKGGIVALKMPLCSFDYQRMPRQARVCDLVLAFNGPPAVIHNDEGMGAPVSLPKACRPSYFIIGSRKAGTTSLHTYLTKHPDVAPFNIRGLPTDGEAVRWFGRFFSHRGPAHRYLQTYNSQFDSSLAHIVGNGSHHDISSRSRIVGESTVSLLVDHEAAQQVFLTCGPRVKIIALLREPIDRLHSNFKMRLRLNTVGVTHRTRFDVWARNEMNAFRKQLERQTHANISQWLAMERPSRVFGSSENMIHEGMIAIFLPHWLDYFPHMKIEFYEEFYDPDRLPSNLDSMMDYIGVDSAKVNSTRIVQEKFNAAPSEGSTSSQATGYDSHMHGVTPQLRSELEALFRPFN